MFCCVLLSSVALRCALRLLPNIYFMNCVQRIMAIHGTTTYYGCGVMPVEFFTLLAIKSGTSLHICDSHVSPITKAH